MPKDLYFIDSIFFHQGDNTASIRLLSTEPQEESARIVTLSSQRLALRGFFGPIKEGYYVYYHENENLPFTYGNRSPFAKRMFQKYYAFLETLSKSFIVPDNSNDDQLINLLQKSDRLHVLSYHVNVGHGNCSFILILVGGEYRLWAVDCSIKDSKGTYRGNLNACLDEIACCAGVKDWHRLHISRFFLTHLHDDHFNGMEDLIDNGIIDANTICYINWYYQMASPVFISIMNKLSKIREAAGISRNDRAYYQPRLHDLRHTFAVNRLTAWYREGKDVQKHLSSLSTYLGHDKVSNTSVYLAMTDELLREASKRFKAYSNGEETQ